MRESQDRPSTALAPPPAREAALLVSCASCERLHQPENPLDLHPVCSRCAQGYPLTSLEMAGSFPLTAEAIDEEITQRSPGNYALGYMDGGTFVVFFVGRSDSDVRSRLRDWVGAASQYEDYAPSGRASWGVHRRGTLPLNAPVLASVSKIDSSYSHFAYSYASSPEAAYAKEWRNYDDFGGDQRRLDNSTAPVASTGSR